MSLGGFHKGPDLWPAFTPHGDRTHATSAQPRGESDERGRRALCGQRVYTGGPSEPFESDDNLQRCVLCTRICDRLRAKS